MTLWAIGANTTANERAVKKRREVQMQCRWCHDYFTTTWSLCFTYHSTPQDSSRQDIYTRHTEERPISRRSVRKTAASVKSFPLVWHCTPAGCLSNHDAAWTWLPSTTSAQLLPLRTSGSVWQWEARQRGAGLTAMVNGAETNAP